MAITKAEKEKLEEEIRILSLKVNDIKMQNMHYEKDTQELSEKKANYLEEVEKVKQELEQLEVARDASKKELEEVKGRLKEARETLAKTRETLFEKEEKLKEVTAENLKQERIKEELKYDINQLQTELEDAQGKLDTKFNTLKGFEEQLRIREALLNRREEMLDFQEKGVKIKK